MSALAESLVAKLRIDIPRPLKRSRLVGALVSPQSKLLSLLWLGTSLRYTNHLQAFQASCRSDGGRGFGHKIAAKYVDFTSTPENSSRSRSYACSTATSSLWSGKALVVCECLVWILTGSDLKSVTALWVGRTARNGSASKLHLSSSDSKMSTREQWSIPVCRGSTYSYLVDAMFLNRGPASCPSTP